MALQRLDAACLAAIIRQLRPRTRKALRASSRTLCSSVDELITVLRLRDEDWTEGQDVSLSKFAALQLLELSAGSCADAEDVVDFLCEQHAEHLVELRSLKLTGCSYTTQDLLHICSCLPGLTSLAAGVTSSGSGHGEPPTQPAGTTSSSGSRGLLELDLTGSYQLSEADIGHLLSLPTVPPAKPLTPGAHNSSSNSRQANQQLQRLCLKTCLAVGPRLSFLGAVPCLQHLDLHGCFKVNDISLRALAAHCASTSATCSLTSSSGSKACQAGCPNQQAGNASNGSKGCDLVGQALEEVTTDSQHERSSRSTDVDTPTMTAAGAAAAGAGAAGANGAMQHIAGLSLASQHHHHHQQQQQQQQGALPPAPAGAPPAAPPGCQLSFLNLSYTRVTDQSMAALSRLAGLRHLGLKGANVGDDGLLHLTRLTGLTALHIKHCHRITEEGIAWLAPLAQLQLLSFGYTSMPEADAIAALLASNHPRLTALDLLSDQLSDTGLKSLGRLTGLQVLKLYQPGVSATGLEQLVGSTAGVCLQSLTLYGAGRVKELTPLGGLPSLASLHLGDSRLASPALAHLTALTHLQQLSLEGEQGLDAGLLQQLLAAGRLSLWEVRVRGCPGVSQDEVEEMVRGDPGAVTQVWYAPAVEPSTDDEEEGWTLCSGCDEEEY